MTDDVRYYCTGASCPAQLQARVETFGKRTRMDVEGLGEEMSKQLVNSGLVKSLPDLYRLTKEQLLELDGFQEKSASNVIDSIAHSKEIPFHRVLFGLNIPDVGWVTAQTLARHFGSIDALARASQEDIQEIEGMGPLRAESIADWFAEQDNLRLVEEIREVGLNLESGDELAPVEGPLTGNTYVITGTLESMTREEAAAELELRGAKVTGSVSKKTTAVVVGEEPGGAKFNKARQLGTPLLDEAAFAELLAANPAPAGRAPVPSAPPTRFGR